MGITREQKQELDGLAEQVKFKVSARGPKIEMGNKCATVTMANNSDGYQKAKEYLWSMIKMPKESEDINTKAKRLRGAAREDE